MAKRSSEAAQRASVERSSACRSRGTTCVGADSGRGRAARTRSARPRGRRRRRCRPRRPAFRSRCPSSAACEALPVAVELEGPAGELDAERDRLGVDAVRAPDHDRFAVLLRAPDDGVEARGRALPEAALRPRAPGVRAPCRGRRTRSGRSGTSGRRRRAGPRPRPRTRPGRAACAPRSRRPAPGSAAWRSDECARPRRPGPLRPRPNLRAPPTRPRASAPACPRPTRLAAWAGGSSAGSPVQF